MTTELAVVRQQKFNVDEEQKLTVANRTEAELQKLTKADKQSLP